VLSLFFLSIDLLVKITLAFFGEDFTINTNSITIFYAKITSSFSQTSFIAPENEIKKKPPHGQKIWQPRISKKKPHFAVAQYPLDLKSKWKP
jgi:hypothetical protein